MQRSCFYFSLFLGVSVKVSLEDIIIVVQA